MFPVFLQLNLQREIYLILCSSEKNCIYQKAWDSTNSIVLFLPSRFVTQALDPYQPLEVLRSFFAVHFDFSGPTCLKSVQESVTSTPPDEGYCSGCSDNHGAHCNLHLSSFFQFSSESLVFLQFVVFLLPDVGIATLPDCI